jgi:translocation and assembly module TamB
MRAGVKKSLKWSGLGLGTLIVLLVAFASWLLFTTSGMRWAANLVTTRFAPQVSYSNIDGTLASEITVTDFAFKGEPQAAQIRIKRLSVEPTLRMLLSRRLRIENARVEGLVVMLPEQPGPEEPDKPMWVQPPLDVVVDDFALLDGRILKGREQLFALRQLDVSAQWLKDELRIENLTLLPGDIEGQLSVRGRVVPSGKLVRGEIDAWWEDVVIPASQAGRELRTEGRLSFEGTPKAYALNGKFDAGPPGEPTQVRVELAGTDARADIRQLHLAQRAGELIAQGTVGFEPVGWQLYVTAHQFNPGALLAGWDGSLNVSANTRGVLAEEGPRGSLVIGALGGNLRGRPVAGEGDIEFAAPSQLQGDLRVSSGRSRVAVRGRSTDGESVDANVTLAMASLADWVPETAGSLNGDFRIRGAWPKLTIAGTAQGRSLSFMEYRVARVDVNADVASPLDPEGEVRVRASEVLGAGFHFATVAVYAEGNQRRHGVAVTARGERLNAAVKVAGGLTEAGWDGELSALSLDTPQMAGLSLRDPARMTLDEGNFSIGQTCLVQEQSALCVQADLRSDGALEARYSFDRVSLALANALAPEAMPGKLRGELAGEGSLRRGADGQLFGAANLASAQAQMVMMDDEPGESVLGQRTLLLYENLDMRANLEGTTATVTLSAGLQHGGSLKARVGARELTAAAPRIEGEIDVSMPTLAPFGAFVPAIGNLDGNVDARILIGGTMAAPEVTGNANVQRLQADLGKLGIELRDGRVEADAGADGGFRLLASVASGKGHLELEGTMSARGVIEARILGKNFEAADIPAAKVTLTPDLRLTGNPGRYLLRGDVTIPRADIDLQKLPKDKAPGTSPDVVVVRNGQVVESASQEQGFPLEAVINVKLGENIAITGFGLESKVGGELEVRESPGVPTTGSGQLMVSGTYKAYGQDLTIQEGRLLFAGSPLDNPRLAIVAMREINDDLSTGLRIAGSAQRPVITVISEPNVGEADALSYLVTGRSLNEVGSASGTSQDALASATQSLQGAGTGLVAKRIGARLGLDEAGVEENEMIGGSALTIGEYLSPRLYLSYGVGLFEPGEVIALRYKLTDDVGVRVQRGSEETRAGVEYRIEK